MNLALPTHHQNNNCFFISQIFQMLEGTWQLQRTLGPQATMQGTASFQKISNACAYYYQERGKVQLQKTCLNAYRAYVYAYQHDNIAVYFWDSIKQQPGNLLHGVQFNLTTEPCWPIHAHGIHNCQQDVYQALYTFYSLTNFQLFYTVDGPSKHYTIKSYFSRTPTT